MRLVVPREPGEKLRPIDEATILELAAAGKSQIEIAAVVGCHQSTVSRTLAEWADTRGLARKYAEAKSLEMMKRFVAEASPPEILKMQAKLDVVREDKQGGDTHVVLTIGQPGRLPPELEPPVIEISAGGSSV
jgi:hypothetical protein